MSQSLLIKEEENRQSSDGLSVSAAHQKSLERCLTEIGSTDQIGGRRELRSTLGRVQREDSCEQVGEVKLKTRK